MLPSNRQKLKGKMLSSQVSRRINFTEPEDEFESEAHINAFVGISKGMQNKNQHLSQY